MQLAVRAFGDQADGTQRYDSLSREEGAPQPVHPGFELKPFGHAWHRQVPGPGANHPGLHRAHENSPGCDLAEPGRHGCRAVPPLHPKLSQPALGNAADKHARGSQYKHRTVSSCILGLSDGCSGALCSGNSQRQDPTRLAGACMTTCKWFDRERTPQRPCWTTARLVLQAVAPPSLQRSVNAPKRCWQPSSVRASAAQ